MLNESATWNEQLQWYCNIIFSECDSLTPLSLDQSFTPTTTDGQIILRDAKYNIEL